MQCYYLRLVEDRTDQRVAAEEMSGVSISGFFPLVFHS